MKCFVAGRRLIAVRVIRRIVLLTLKSGPNRDEVAAWSGTSQRLPILWRVKSTRYRFSFRLVQNCFACDLSVVSFSVLVFYCQRSFSTLAKKNIETMIVWN